MIDNTSDDTLRGIRAWVSGGAGAIGAAIGKALLSNGAAGVVLVDCREPTALEFDGTVYFHVFDVRNKDKLSESLANAHEQLGGLDLVVNCAGLVAEHDIGLSLSVNLEAVIHATEAAIRILGRNSSIVNISSAAGVFPAPDAPLYAAAKHGVVGYTRSRGRALRKKGLHLNVLCPAWVDAGVGIFAKQSPTWQKQVDIAGVMTAEYVAEVLLSIVQNKKLFGDAVYVSAKQGISYPLRGLRPNSQRHARL